MGLRERVYFPSFVSVISYRTYREPKKKSNQKIMADIINDKYNYTPHGFKNHITRKVSI